MNVESKKHPEIKRCKVHFKCIIKATLTVPSSSMKKRKPGCFEHFGKMAAFLFEEFCKKPRTRMQLWGSRIHSIVQCYMESTTKDQWRRKSRYPNVVPWKTIRQQDRQIDLPVSVVTWSDSFILNRQWSSVGWNWLTWCLFVVNFAGLCWGMRSLTSADSTCTPFFRWLVSVILAQTTLKKIWWDPKAKKCQERKDHAWHLSHEHVILDTRR